MKQEGIEFSDKVVNTIKNRGRKQPVIKWRSYEFVIHYVVNIVRDKLIVKRIGVCQEAYACQNKIYLFVIYSHIP